MIFVFLEDDDEEEYFKPMGPLAVCTLDRVFSISVQLW